VGFSGDDPNFLQWSGWVRDHLGEKARRIYLVGSLDLSASKRRLLESRGVSPIDFATLIKDVPSEDKDRTCCDLFLSYLANKKPRRAIDWEPNSHKAYPVINPATVQTELESPDSASRILQSIS
jgi:hypothetical protein